MSIRQEPSTHKLFLIACKAPQSVEIPCQSIKKRFIQQGALSAPMPPIVPLLYSHSYPPPPVPGLLPACSSPLCMKNMLQKCSGNDWIIWPVDSGSWFSDLLTTLGSDDNVIKPEFSFPLGAGIPIILDTHKEDCLFSEKSYDEKIQAIVRSDYSWRALHLVCYSLEFQDRQKWFRSIYWEQMWIRRLRRAPAQANPKESSS